MDREQRLQYWGLDHRVEVHEFICRKYFVKRRNRRDNICRSFSIRAVCIAFKALSMAGPFDDRSI